LWKSSVKAPEAAEVLKLTSQDLFKLGVIDEIVPEPQGGAHRDPQKMGEILRQVLTKNLNELSGLKKEELLKARYKKFRDMGQVKDQ
jgi:acetyl-CoA carboxylase carboxyl transferase subunit alpha